jgi:hypothetical protein
MVRNIVFVGVVLLSSCAVANAQTPAAQTPNAQPRGEHRLPQVNLDGQWTVQYAEMDGKVIENKSVANVTIKGNVVTCKHEGKEKSWRLEFGPHHMVRCMEEIDGKATSDGTSNSNTSAKGYHSHHGVYIAGQQYFCLSMNKGRDMRHLTTGVEQNQQQPRNAQPAQAFGSGHGPHGSAFILILHRAATSTK